MYRLHTACLAILQVFAMDMTGKTTEEILKAALDDSRYFPAVDPNTGKSARSAGA